MSTFILEDEDATIALGEKLALSCAFLLKNQDSAIVIHLLGDLGAGKTTLSRGFLHGLGYQGTVKSPTYTLVEPYQFKDFAVYHFDLYRLAEPEELEFMGIRDYFDSRCICLIEWPERAEGFLPEADLIVSLDYLYNQRQVTLLDRTKIGQKVMARVID